MAEAAAMRDRLERYVPNEPIGRIGAAALMLGAAMLLAIILIVALGR